MGCLVQHGSALPPLRVAQVHICSCLEKQVQRFLWQPGEIVCLQQHPIWAVLSLEQHWPALFCPCIGCRFRTNDGTQAAVPLWLLLQASHLHSAADFQLRVRPKSQAEMKRRESARLGGVHNTALLQQQPGRNDIPQLRRVMQRRSVLVGRLLHGLRREARVVLRVGVSGARVRPSIQQQLNNPMVALQHGCVQRLSPDGVLGAWVCPCGQQHLHSLAPA
mmetsp:Transcript_2570/g.3835  ORF Transcript_2570/g.3835 Transcript_2570/m.3835 type:complete len:220 (-) Transcript_2570:5-664(-)